MKLSIIVPYRNREEHLKFFIPFMNDYLQKQKINFSITIVEQSNEKPFNRGKLLNIGFKETCDDHEYFCFHDIDMLPEKADYSFVNTPTHLATKVEQFNYSLPYDGYFGGVLLIDKNNFMISNGYSNEYWGWGAEDDDFRDRCLSRNIRLSRKECYYKSLYHTPNGDTNGGTESPETKKNRERYISLKNNQFYFLNEGLNSLEYKIIYKDNNIFNHIKVDL